MMAAGEKMPGRQRLVDHRLLHFLAGRPVAQRHDQGLVEAAQIVWVAALAVAIEQEGRIVLCLGPLAFAGDIAAYGRLHRDGSEGDRDRNGSDANEDEGDGQQLPGQRRASCRIERHRVGSRDAWIVGIVRTA